MSLIIVRRQRSTPGGEAAGGRPGVSLGARARPAPHPKEQVRGGASRVQRMPMPLVSTMGEHRKGEGIVWTPSPLHSPYTHTHTYMHAHIHTCTQTRTQTRSTPGLLSTQKIVLIIASLFIDASSLLPGLSQPAAVVRGSALFWARAGGQPLCLLRAGASVSPHPDSGLEPAPHALPALPPMGS